ncbi:MAG: nucleotidyltransferase family protein [Proteobacteria bacterium]|nr:nucleotidyltransferase family protein [Pseudomonadota bacterium]MBU1741723.1 nucleotidyltransferase family protein [Pseudomonadota bacterium]
MSSHASDLNRILLSPRATIQEAMMVMTSGEGTPLIMVVDEERRLLGVVADFDLRKALLNGQGLDSPLSGVMNTSPVCLPRTIDREGLEGFFRREARASVPLLDERDRVVGIAYLAEVLVKSRELPHWVVIMAGGKGRRLRPMTEKCPKSLVTINDKPLLEITIEQFVAAGLTNIIISVHHLADRISDRIGDGSRFGAKIDYLHEPEPLGTAGALGLLRDRPSHPLVVANGDLLTKVNYRALLEFHEAENPAATICVREHHVEVPFGVVELQGIVMDDLVEKPVIQVMVNAGIYVLDPGALDFIPQGRRMDMTELLNLIRGEDRSMVRCFPIHEYWLDIGTPQDLARAEREYAKEFGR